MTELRFTLLGDGPSDACLLRHVRWLVEQYASDKLVLQAAWADLAFFRDKPRGLAQRIQAALELYPCDLLFVWRTTFRRSCDSTAGAKADDSDSTLVASELRTVTRATR